MAVDMYKISQLIVLVKSQQEPLNDIVHAEIADLPYD